MSLKYEPASEPLHISVKLHALRGLYQSFYGRQVFFFLQKCEEVPRMARI